MFEQVLKGGQVFWGDTLIQADLAIEGSKIAAVGSNLKGKSELDATGRWILPGAVDVHTHFSLPFAGAISADDFYSGSVAAACGGVTTFIDFTAQAGDEGVLDSLKRRREQADPLVAVDYSLHACIGNYSAKVAEQLPLLASHGVTSLKIFMAYGKSGLMQNDKGLLNIMTACRQHGILVTVHAENGCLIDLLTDQAAEANNLGIESLPLTRPVFSETEAIRRIADFSRYTGCKVYVVHVSSGEGAQILGCERQRGAHIAGETCPQYLYLDEKSLSGPTGHFYGCCPPIRSKNQQKLLWQRLAANDLAVVATDHCPFTTSDKNSWQNKITSLPMGLPGIETLPLLVLNGVHSEKISLQQAVKAISENPARIFGLYPQKGSLMPGTDADIMVYNPDCNHEISVAALHMRTDYSPYEGLQCRGCNEMTILRGKVVYSRQNGWQGEKGGGRFVERHATDAEFFIKKGLPA
ncbi:MAG: dihydropyrimidinase [Candidatus Riflebacteria bacterium HGW-Riflebacteria-1]|jgi:dihydropyrimidinase|nr:MAG: dihydropyrimidinase [Candidatus Riflebacteria bacterium HGW-Riflebacteria-1]